MISVTLIKNEEIDNDNVEWTKNPNGFAATGRG